jgi:hypothetical protein
MSRTNSWGTLFHCTRYVLILTKNWSGNILGDFLINTSGHPAAEPSVLRNRRLKNENLIEYSRDVGSLEKSCVTITYLATALLYQESDGISSQTSTFKVNFAVVGKKTSDFVKTDTDFRSQSNDFELQRHE